MNRKSNGFTLVELIITLCVSSIVLVSLFSFFIFIQKQYQHELTRIHEHHSLRRFIQVIEDHVRMSSQSIIVNHEGMCTSLYDLHDDNEIAKYCAIEDKHYVVDSGVVFAGITNLSLNLKLEFGIESIEIIVEGSLGQHYAKEIILRK